MSNWAVRVPGAAFSMTTFGAAAPAPPRRHFAVAPLRDGLGWRARLLQGGELANLQPVFATEREAFAFAEQQAHEWDRLP